MQKYCFLFVCLFELYLIYLSEKAIDEDGLLLAEAKYAKQGLCVVRRIPGGVEDDAAVGADEIDADAAGLGRDQEEASARIRLVVERVHVLGPIVRAGLAVYTIVVDARQPAARLHLKPPPNKYTH